MLHFSSNFKDMCPSKLEMLESLIRLTDAFLADSVYTTLAGLSV